MLLSFSSSFSAKMAVSDVSQKQDVILRFFENLEHQNILHFTVWPIVPITLLFLINRQFGRFAAKNSNLLDLYFGPFWSNVTYSLDSPVNVLIKSRNVPKIGTVSSNRIYNLQNARNYFYLRHIDSLQNINGMILHHYSLQILSLICTLRI